MKRCLLSALGLLIFVYAHAQMADFRPYKLEPTSRWVSLPGQITLNYFEQGSSVGLPVILIHGYADSYHSFDGMLPYMNQGLHIYAITLRGFGDSDKPEGAYDPEIFARDISQFMDALKIESAVLVGHSMGSSIVQRFALDYPQKTKALVLISSIVNFSTLSKVKELCDVVSEMKSMNYEFVKAFQRGSFEKMIDSSYFNLLVNESMKAPVYVWKAAISGLIDVNYTAEIHRIHVPVLILWGEKDGISLLNEQQELHVNLVHSSFVSYYETGHSPQWEKPENVANEIGIFLEMLVKR